MSAAAVTVHGLSAEPNPVSLESMSLLPSGHRTLRPKCWRLLFAFGASLLVGACQSGNTSREEVPAGPAAPTIPYHFAVADPSPGAEASLQREILGAVRAALAAKGMYEVPRGTPAELTLSLEYGVGPAHDGRVNGTEPIYETTPGKIVDQFVIVGIGGNGSSVSELRKVKEPDVVIYQGERPVTLIRKVYEKSLHLSARANGAGSDGRPAREIWSLALIAEGPSRDFKKLLPVLAGPGRHFLGDEGDGPTILRINEDRGTIDSVERSF